MNIHFIAVHTKGQTTQTMKADIVKETFQRNHKEIYFNRYLN